MYDVGLYWGTATGKRTGQLEWRSQHQRGWPPPVNLDPNPDLAFLFLIGTYTKLMTRFVARARPGCFIGEHDRRAENRGRRPREEVRLGRGQQAPSPPARASWGMGGTTILGVGYKIMLQPYCSILLPENFWYIPHLWLLGVDCCYINCATISMVN